MCDRNRLVRLFECAWNSRSTGDSATVSNMEALSLAGAGHMALRRCSRLRRERHADRGRRTRVEERPSLRLPMPFDEALRDETPETADTEEKVERGVAVVDFYI